MTIEREEGRVVLVLPEECVVDQVEAATDRARSELGEADAVCIDGSRVREMDTAYFQLLQSICSSAAEIGFDLEVRTSVAIEDILALYGLTIRRK